MLKRFESSAEAFRRTLGRMLHEHEVFLEALSRGCVVRKEFFREISAVEDEGDIEEILEASEYSEDVAERSQAEEIHLITWLALQRETELEPAEKSLDKIFWPIRVAGSPPEGTEHGKG